MERELRKLQNTALENFLLPVPGVSLHTCAHSLTASSSDSALPSCLHPTGGARPTPRARCPLCKASFPRGPLPMGKLPAPGTVTALDQPRPVVIAVLCCYVAGGDLPGRPARTEPQTTPDLMQVRVAEREFEILARNCDSLRGTRSLKLWVRFVPRRSTSSRHCVDGSKVYTVCTLQGLCR